MANQGNIEAQKNLGYIYLEKENYEKAFYWYKKASDQGDFGAELIIKKMYANGFIK
jgi:TPR repeat protein